MTGIHVAYVLLYFPCLTETFVAEEIRSLKQKGVNVHLFSLLPSRDTLIHPVSRQLLSQARYAPGLFHPSLWFAQVYFFLKSPARYLDLFAGILREPAPHPSFLLKRIVIFFKGSWLARQLEHIPVQLVHTHFAWLSAVAGVVVSQLLNVPYTVTTHAYDIYSVKNDLLILTSRYANRIVTISDANKNAICEMNPRLDPEKVNVIHCGIDLDYFSSAPGKPISKTVQITSVGSLIAKKGHEYLIRACGELEKMHLDFQCVIVGRGELEPSLLNLIRDLGLSDRVHLAGARSQDWVRERLCQSDVFVLACVDEEDGGRDGIPVALMEAMAMAVPVISTSVSGIPELVRNGETGLLIPERNEEALAQAICRLSTDNALRHSLIENGLALICQEYDIAKNASRLSTLFEQTIRERHP